MKLISPHLTSPHTVSSGRPPRDQHQPTHTPPPPLPTRKIPSRKLRRTVRSHKTTITWLQDLPPTVCIMRRWNGSAEGIDGRGADASLLSSPSGRSTSRNLSTSTSSSITESSPSTCRPATQAPVGRGGSARRAHHNQGSSCSQGDSAAQDRLVGYAWRGAAGLDGIPGEWEGRDTGRDAVLFPPSSPSPRCDPALSC